MIELDKKQRANDEFIKITGLFLGEYFIFSNVFIIEKQDDETV